jgi:hypothetical protein
MTNDAGFDNKTNINFAIEKCDKDKIIEYADAEGLSLSNFIRKCINHYINPDDNSDNADDTVDDIDYLMDYVETMINPDYISNIDLSDREGYHVDDEGYEYFMGVHCVVGYTEPIELRRTPEGYIEFRLLDDDRGFVFASYNIWNVNHVNWA